jgi:hypothetical protein
MVSKWKLEALAASSLKRWAREVAAPAGYPWEPGAARDAIAAYRRLRARGMVGTDGVPFASYGIDEVMGVVCLGQAAADVVDDCGSPLVRLGQGSYERRFPNGDH